mmetsp:Transcript_35598/g.115354  ORF Transcript_35598/g.115354 Transcript_35598/m.115354 type:complete len:255 (-) Transcript_35598:2-766(-)
MSKMACLTSCIITVSFSSRGSDRRTELRNCCSSRSWSWKNVSTKRLFARQATALMETRSARFASISRMTLRTAARKRSRPRRTGPLTAAKRGEVSSSSSSCAAAEGAAAAGRAALGSARSAAALRLGEASGSSSSSSSSCSVSKPAPERDPRQAHGSSVLRAPRLLSRRDGVQTLPNERVRRRRRLGEPKEHDEATAAEMGTLLRDGLAAAHGVTPVEGSNRSAASRRGVAAGRHAMGDGRSSQRWLLPRPLLP